MMAVPVTLLLGQLALWYQARPLRVGEDTVITLELNGDRAHVTSTWVYLIRADGDVPQVSKIGHYDDVLTREDGRWKFLSRTAPMDIPSP